MIKIRQIFNRDRIENPAGELAARLRTSGLLDRVKPGMRIAVATGSRGIHGIAGLVRTVVDELKQAGAQPFIVPAMGSHGGGTAEGQLAVLESFGISEATMNVPVISSIETETIGATPSGAPVFMDRNALGSDGIVVINRIKIHTAFHGRVESGLCKIVAVGLGKREGASTLHRCGLGEEVVESFRVARVKAPILFGVGILENAFDETLDFMVVGAEDFEKADHELLERCRAIVPRVPFREFDILIVDEMGKNISGTGMDTNIIGFWRRFGGERVPDYSTLIVRDLTPESHGNAMGIGFADLTTRRLVDKIDYGPTYTNGITSGTWAIVRIPITLENDFECIRTALEKHEPGQARIIRIKNTLELEELHISGNLLEGIRVRDDLEVIGKPEEMRFDAGGNLV
ncbi:lactate racemase domain-containing protein [bacterium]|nr:lactate racemase domain-containing protein [bacterium]